ncbi:DUF5615 family PIN-like protein [Roseofilum sp. Guam]|uniref:DUF5615 family PIN-like protein n=1 Tax=Roseofilum sp. Guam TaxID=2821502 RepID=UPI001B159B90|nr:DUF5615 family PIN-like protein [Roseofilum sp. Guam]MBP0029472.1 DUF5615 family PIN-like protein [Roseofilum sp. Guam]
MLKLLADENFDNAIVRGLLRRDVSIDIVRVQDVGLSGIDDPTILAWAADRDRVLLTHDVATITRYAYERMEQNLPMAGVIEIPMGASIGQAIEDILLLLECSTENEIAGQIHYLPF